MGDLIGFAPPNGHALKGVFEADLPKAVFVGIGLTVIDALAILIHDSSWPSM